MSSDLKRLERLMAMMQSLGIRELTYEGGGKAIRLVSAVQSGDRGGGLPVTDVIDALDKAPDKQVSRQILASMHGVFYRSESAEELPFVDAGSVVRAGDTICLVEAMKILSRIEAEYSCRVISVLKKDGDIIEPGMALFEVELIDA